MPERKELDAADLKDRIRKNHLSRRGEIEDEDELELILVLGPFPPEWSLSTGKRTSPAGR